MNKLLAVFFLSLAMTLPAGAVAQQEKGSAGTYIYASYFRCKNTMLDPVDASVNTDLAPVYDAAVSDGTIAGWGWLAHHTGGVWSRAFYTMSDSMAELLQAQKTMAERTKGVPDGGFSEACGEHEDYIWQNDFGNGLAGDRGAVALSAYHDCQPHREPRADRIMRDEFGPVYDKAVQAGKIKSWGWSSHVIGGKYRKLSTMTASSFEQLMAARQEILREIAAKVDKKTANEFVEICGVHEDYLWQVLNEGRP